MIIEELKSFLRATILISTDMNKKEFSLEVLEKIIAMEQKLKSMEPIEIEPPVADLPAGGDWRKPTSLTATQVKERYSHSVDEFLTQNAGIQI